MEQDNFSPWILYGLRGTARVQKKDSPRSKRGMELGHRRHYQLPLSTSIKAFSTSLAHSTPYGCSSQDLYSMPPAPFMTNSTNLQTPSSERESVTSPYDFWLPGKARVRRKAAPGSSALSGHFVPLLQGLPEVGGDPSPSVIAPGSQSAEVP